MDKLPKVTVLMPVYNGELYLREAIDSILHQSFSDFELLIINDASTDHSVEIIKSYTDKRIRLVHNDKNLKLVSTLNKGLELARGIYIARMDCDDISLPMRLSKQVEFLDEHLDVKVLGTGAKIIDEFGTVGKNVRVYTGKILKNFFWIPSPLIHPSVMMRREVILQNKYDIDYERAEDYELWLRIHEKHKIENLSECLLMYRMHKNNVSKIYQQEQLKATYKAFCKYNKKKISYDLFLAFIRLEYKINPVKRNFLFLKYMYKRGTPINFIMESLKYIIKWIQGKFISYIN